MGQAEGMERRCAAGLGNSEIPSGHPSGDARWRAGMSGAQGQGGDGDVNGKVISRNSI